jgi:hypothetical protein
MRHGTAALITRFGALRCPAGVGKALEVNTLAMR